MVSDPEAASRRKAEQQGEHRHLSSVSASKDVLKISRNRQLASSAGPGSEMALAIDRPCHCCAPHKPFQPNRRPDRRQVIAHTDQA